MRIVSSQVPETGRSACHVGPQRERQGGQMAEAGTRGESTHLDWGFLGIGKAGQGEQLRTG